MLKQRFVWFQIVHLRDSPRQVEKRHEGTKIRLLYWLLFLFCNKKLHLHKSPCWPLRASL